jgi:hypothetical protein
MLGYIRHLVSYLEIVHLMVIATHQTSSDLPSIDYERDWLDLMTDAPLLTPYEALVAGVTPRTYDFMFDHYWAVHHLVLIFDPNRLHLTSLLDGTTFHA